LPLLLSSVLELLMRAALWESLKVTVRFRSCAAPLPRCLKCAHGRRSAVRAQGAGGRADPEGVSVKISSGTRRSSAANWREARAAGSASLGTENFRVTSGGSEPPWLLRNRAKNLEWLAECRPLVKGPSGGLQAEASDVDWNSWGGIRTA
jgi:hypothetical protein